MLRTRAPWELIADINRPNACQVVLIANSLRESHGVGGFG